jgi:glycerophosphoryl diester phosphodiesterase
MIWCVNTKEDLREIQQQFGDQLDGIMTDNPIVLKSYVDDLSNEI